jgi:hypothetical protein
MMGLFLALAAGVLAAPASAGVQNANTCDYSNDLCGTLVVRPVDAQTGAPIVGARVIARMPNSSAAVILWEVSDGSYEALVKPGEWKITVEAPAYDVAEAAAIVGSAQQTEVKVEVAPSDRDSDATPAISNLRARY